jgi:phosphatidylinositol glycan class B
LFIVTGVLLVALLGFLLDTALYHQPHFSVLRYLTMGFAGDPSHRFDTLPWYYYPPWIIKYAIPPVGLGLLLALVILLWKRPSHLLVWCIAPYLLVHSFIAHKELRFLYPLADLAPLLLIAGLIELRSMTFRAPKSITGSLIALFVLSNVLGSAVVMSSAAGAGRTKLAKALSEDRPTEGAMIAYVIKPEEAWRISLPAFYLPEGMRDTAFLASHINGEELKVEYIVVQKTDLKALPTHFSERTVLMASTEAAWVFELMAWYTWGEGSAPWSLYRTGPADQ